MEKPLTNMILEKELNAEGVLEPLLSLQLIFLDS